MPNYVYALFDTWYAEDDVPDLFTTFKKAQTELERRYKNTIVECENLSLKQKEFRIKHTPRDMKLFEFKDIKKDKSDPHWFRFCNIIKKEVK